MCNNGPAWLWLYTQYNIYMQHASLCYIVRCLSAAFCMIRLEEVYIHSTSNTKKRYSYTHCTCLCESVAPHASLQLMGMILTPLTTGVILVHHQTRTVAPRGSIHTSQVMTAFNWLPLKGYDRGMRTVCLKPHTMRSTPGTIVLLWWPETMVMLYIATSGTKCCTWLHTCEQMAPAVPQDRRFIQHIPQEWYRKGPHTPLAGDHRSHARLTDEANCEEISSYF